MRMLMNNLDPEVGERPRDLVVYGGTGRAARSWEAYHAIVASLKQLANDETLLVQSGKPVGVFQTHEYAPRAIKLAVSGYGAADKAQVAQMVTALLSLERRPAADAADALAVALCHAQTRRMAALAAAPAPLAAPRSTARRGRSTAARSGVRP